MKGAILGIIIIAGLIVQIMLVSQVKAEETTAPGQIHEVQLSVGEIFKVCKSGIVVCPALVSICDDASIIMIVSTPDGLGFKGVAPGATLCSVGTTVGPRRLFRVTVQ